MNLVIGILVMMSYMLYFNSGGQALGRANLLDVSVLAFVFGTIAFVVAGLGFWIMASTRQELAELEWESGPNPAYVPNPLQVNQAQVSTRQYVTQLRRTIREEAIAPTDVRCSNCGREISEADNFCDICGAPTRPDTIGQQASEGLAEA